MAWNDKDEILIEVRRLINERVPMLITDTDINAWIDFAVNEMCEQGLLMEDISSIQLDSITPERSLAFGASELGFTPMAAVFVGSSVTAPNTTGAPVALVKTHPRQQGHNFPDDTTPAVDDLAREWWYLNNEIYMFPQYGTTYINDFITIFHYVRVDAYDTDGSEIIEHLREYVIWYAVARAFQKMGNLQAASQYMSIFNNYLAFHRQDDLHNRSNAKDEMKIQDRTRVIQ